MMRYLWLMGALLCMTACGQSADDIADAKLATVMDAPSVPTAVPRPSEPMPTISYEANKDPFVNPYRQANTEPPTAQNTSVPSDNSDAKSDTGVDNKPKPSSDQPSSDASKIAKPPQEQPSKPASANTSANTSQKPAESAWYRHAKRIKIDTQRPRQPLELFELGQLSYQGRISDGARMVAIVQSPDGRAHQVAVGHYLGRHHGQVVRIDERGIYLDEAVLADDGYYYHRTAELGFMKK